jgi:hypothetical protein
MCYTYSEKPRREAELRPSSRGYAKPHQSVMRQTVAAGATAGAAVSVTGFSFNFYFLLNLAIWKFFFQYCKTFFGKSSSDSYKHQTGHYR